jgi:hypothetical protein
MATHIVNLASIKNLNRAMGSCLRGSYLFCGDPGAGKRLTTMEEGFVLVIDGIVAS